MRRHILLDRGAFRFETWAEFWDRSGRARFVSASLVLACLLFMVGLGLWFAFFIVLDLVRDAVNSIERWVRG
jgi:hypothetical protein